MRGRLLLAVVAGMTVALGGCGTVLNFAGGDPEVYGGVQGDLAFIQTPSTEPPSWGCGEGGVFFVGFVLADVALSAVTDTLTLPLAIYLRQNEHHKPGKPAQTVGAGNPGDRGGPAVGDGLGPLDWGGPVSATSHRKAQPTAPWHTEGGPLPPPLQVPPLEAQQPVAPPPAL